MPYGVAPGSRPRIKEIIKALRRGALSVTRTACVSSEMSTTARTSGLPISGDTMTRVIFSTGARADRALDIPGIDLPGSYGAADFVSWYDGHPDVPRAPGR